MFILSEITPWKDAIASSKRSVCEFARAESLDFKQIQNNVQNFSHEMTVGRESPHTQTVLNEQAAQEIYRCKLQLQAEREDLPHRAARSALRGQSLRISYMFDVSPKTIRDIWSHRTWQRVTRHLWEGNDVRDQDRWNRQRNGIGLELDSLNSDLSFVVKGL